MSEKLNWNLSVNATGGPQLAHAGTSAVDGYDKLQVTLTKAQGTTLSVGPGKWSGVSLLMVKPSILDPKLTYKTGTLTAALDGTLLLVGSGAVSLLGDGDAQLAFNYGGDAEGDIVIHVLVGRNAS
jgi:hypothetical protein